MEMVVVLFSFLKFVISIARRKRQNMGKIKVIVLKRNGSKHVSTEQAKFLGKGIGRGDRNSSVFIWQGSRGIGCERRVFI
jgi:hypothetical protein